MSDQKYQDQDNYSLELMDSNIKQIEATNNIINNLENQLNGFFSKQQYSSGGYSNSNYQNNNQEMMLQINQYSPNLLQQSPSKQIDESYSKQMNQQNNSTMIIHNMEEGDDFHQNKYAEGQSSSSKKQYNFYQDNIQMYKLEDHNRNQLQDKYRNVEQQIKDEQEENNRDVEVVEQYKSDGFENEDLQRIKQQYILNNYHSSQQDERRLKQGDIQDDSVYQYKSQQIQGINFSQQASSSNHNRNQHQAPLFQNKNLMQHFQNPKYEMLESQQQQLQQQIQQRQQILQQQHNPIERVDKQIIHEELDENSQLFRGDQSHGRGNKSMLDNSVLSVKNKDELENELLQLQRRLNQLDQESLTRRNQLEQTISTISPQQTQQQPPLSTGSQLDNGLNQIGGAYSVNNNSTISAMLQQKQTVTNREILQQNYQSGSSRTNSIAQNSHNTSAILPSTTSTRGNDSIVSKLQKMEEFYQNRTRILEERINVLENENQKLLKANSELMQQNEQFQQKLLIQKEQFSLEIQQKLKEQETRLNSEFELNLNRFTNKNQEFLSLQLEEKHVYSKELDQIKEDRKNLMKELEDLRRNHIELADERDNINQSYSNLLAVHNQMLQIDIQKNERSLHHSFCQSSYSDRNSKPAVVPNQLIFGPSKQLINDEDLIKVQLILKKAQNLEQRIENQQAISDRHQIPRNSNSTINQFQKINDESSRANQEQPEWREELGKLKEELEIERRQRDKLESELRNQNNQNQEKRLQEDNEEINALYQKIFMTRELKARDTEKNKNEGYDSNTRKNVNYSSNERLNGDENQQNDEEERQFAPRFQHKDNKDNVASRNVQFEVQERRNSIFKNESISSNIPKSYSSNLNLKKNDLNGQSDYQYSRVSQANDNQIRSSSQSSKELKRIINQEGLQKKPPKTGGLASTPKKQLKDQGSRDNSQKRYNSVASTQQLANSSSVENYNTANYNTNDSEPLHSKFNNDDQIKDKKIVKQFIKEIDRLKKAIESKKKKSSNNSGNQTPIIQTASCSSNSQQGQERKNNKSSEYHNSNIKKSTKTPINSSKKTVVSSQDSTKRNLLRSNSANKQKI